MTAMDCEESSVPDCLHLAACGRQAPDVPKPRVGARVARSLMTGSDYRWPCPTVPVDRQLGAQGGPAK